MKDEQKNKEREFYNTLKTEALGQHWSLELERLTSENLTGSSPISACSFAWCISQQE